MNLLLYPFLWFARFCLFLRYRITVKGLKEIKSKGLKGGILFLPNHPAEVDPIIVESLLWRCFRPKPLVVEHFYYLKGFKRFMDWVGAMPIPFMETKANKWRAQKVERQFAQIAGELKEKKNFLIYPSGALRRTEIEMIGGASLVHRIVQEVPQCQMVLVRTTGLWGSKFSKALTGISPDFGKTLWECAKILLKNGLFFAPRRSVLVEFELPPADFPYGGTRLEFNKALEEWYNQRPDPLILVSYAFWKEELAKVTRLKPAEVAVEEKPVAQKIQQEVIGYLGTLSGKEPKTIQRSMHLSHDLGLDSLDIIQVHLFLEERYARSGLHPGEINTVEDTLQCAAGYFKKQGEELSSKSKKRFVWPKQKRQDPKIPLGETIQEVFLKSAARGGARIAAADHLMGLLTYSKLKIAVLLLSLKFRKIPENHVGVMLPSSSGAYLTILAVLLANKVPVMLNWTSGSKALDHCVDVTGIKTVITSDRFLDRLEVDGLGKAEEHLCCLEKIRKSVTIRDTLKALFLSWLPVELLIKILSLRKVQPSDSAVILFTSGTESLPKGVPLTHHNLLSNQRNALEAMPLRANDLLYGVLPPFHSFGFSVTGLLPLLAGLKVCYAPDPTDSHGLAHDISSWKPTLFCCAPSFIQALFRIAKPEDLRSLRLIVSGAEKTPQNLFHYVQNHLPNAHLLEGYGITECSPIVTLQRMGEPHSGVGKALPSIELMIVDEEKQEIEGSKEGEICIAGPNVFAGYLGNLSDPFLIKEGKKWFISGDRGYIKKGVLILSGRTKRFIKMGAEMISLGGLEEDLTHLAKENHWAEEAVDGPILAVTARQKESDRPEIILFTTFSVSKEKINESLKSAGHSRLIKISQVRVLEQIPLTGTGKTHYRLLDEMGEQ